MGSIDAVTDDIDNGEKEFYKILIDESSQEEDIGSVLGLYMFNEKYLVQYVTNYNWSKNGAFLIYQ